MISSQDQISSIDEITSPLNVQIFDFCDLQLFQEPFQASEVASVSNRCEDNENSLFPNNDNDDNNNTLVEKSGSFDDNDVSNTNTTTRIATTTENNYVNEEEDNDADADADLPIVFDSHEDDLENDIAASIDFSSSLQFPVSSDHLFGTTGQQDQFDFSAVSVQQTLNILYSSSEDPLALTPPSSVAPQPQPQPQPPLPSTVFEEDCLTSVPSYNVGINSSSPSCTFFGTPGLPAYMAVARSLNHGVSSESSGFVSDSVHLGPDLQPRDPLLDYQSDNGGIFGPDPIKRTFNPRDLQVLSRGAKQPHFAAVAAAPPRPLRAETSGLDGQPFSKVRKLSMEQRNVKQPHFAAVAAAPPPPLWAEICGLDDPTFSKVRKLSVEQRKEKIHRYMKKRNERNFSKKIKYACRKTLADSRPRVRGRFAKNDEFGGEAYRQASSSHHEDDDDDEVGVKEEEQMVDSSDIFSHMSGVNYSIQSWI